MSDFVNLVGVDGNHRAFHVDDLRLLEDDTVSEADPIETRSKVTLVDGTQFFVKGDVAEIMKIIDASESL